MEILKKCDSIIFIHIPSQPQPAWHYETLLSFVRLPIALPQQCQGRGSGQSLSVVRIQLLIACSWAMRVTCDLWCASFKGYFSFFWSLNFSLSPWWSIEWLVHVLHMRDCQPHLSTHSCRALRLPAQLCELKCIEHKDTGQDRTGNAKRNKALSHVITPNA